MLFTFGLSNLNPAPCSCGDPLAIANYWFLALNSRHKAPALCKIEIK